MIDENEKNIKFFDIFIGDFSFLTSFTYLIFKSDIEHKRAKFNSQNKKNHCT